MKHDICITCLKSYNFIMKAPDGHAYGTNGESFLLLNPINSVHVIDLAALAYTNKQYHTRSYIYIMYAYKLLYTRPLLICFHMLYAEELPCLAAISLFPIGTAEVPRLTLTTSPPLASEIFCPARKTDFTSPTSPGW